MPACLEHPEFPGVRAFEAREAVLVRDPLVCALWGRGQGSTRGGVETGRAKLCEKNGLVGGRKGGSIDTREWLERGLIGTSEGPDRDQGGA